MKEISDSDGNVFGEAEPVSDFEKKCQALRGWRVGDIAADPTTEEVGLISSVEENGRLILMIDPIDDGCDVFVDYEPSDLINLSRP